MILTPQAYLNEATALMEAAGQQETAIQQSAYMKNHFPFYGLKAPQQKPIVTKLFREYGTFSGNDLAIFVELCFEADYRELHYLAMSMVEKVIKKQSANFIEVLEDMIQSKSWWDSVDWISKFVCIHFKRFPELIKPVTRKWMDSQNIWLQRVAIIFQRYKNYPTDEVLLFNYILEVADTKEFFLQKGAGWALRDHAKTHPQVVRKFVEAHPELPALTKREALKNL